MASFLSLYAENLLSLHRFLEESESEIAVKTMKKCIISLVLALMSVAGYAQNVLGKWVTTDNESNVEIYQSGDKLFGKARCPQSRQEPAQPQAAGRQHPDRSHQERQQVGRRQDLQSDERQDLQVRHLARGQHPKSPRLRRCLLRNPHLDAEVISLLWLMNHQVPAPRRALVVSYFKESVVLKSCHQ